MELQNIKKLGFGLMRLPKMTDTSGNERIDLERVTKMVDSFMKKGFSYYDTAYIYDNGESERTFREAVVKRYPRDAYTITDKIPMMNITKEEQLAPVFEEMLERCGVEYFDYLWLHALGEVNYERAVSTNAFAFVQCLKEEGKAKHIGFSYHGSADLLDEILSAHPEMEYVQLQINYIDWEDPTVQARRCYEVCTKHGRPVIVMEPVKGGSLVDIPSEAESLFRDAEPDWSNVGWAIRFAASLPNVMVVLSGMSNEEQLDDNMGYMEDFIPLTESQTDLTLSVADIIRKNIAIPCTACRYCISICPKKIAIPDYFAVYNTMERFGSSAYGDVINYYNGLIQKHGVPADCIRCGLCESHCPQRLPIRQYLENVKASIEG